MAFEKNWRERKIVHRTPGGKMTRVKIGSLPADEQQKYNPNRYKRDADTKMGEEDFRELQKRDVELGHIFDFYIQVDDVSDLDELDDDEMVLATTDSDIVRDYFDDDKIIIKLKNVPMDAVKKVASSDDDDDEPIDLENSSNMEFEDIDELEGNERYEKIKFNTDKIYQLEVKPYLEYIEVVVDSPESEDDDLEEIQEGFYNYYYIGEML